jgi:hypothetical protein
MSCQRLRNAEPPRGFDLRHSGIDSGLAKSVSCDLASPNFEYYVLSKISSWS